MAQAQDRSGNFLDNLFNRGEQQQQQPQQQVPQERAAPGPGGQAALGDPSDPGTRFERIENALRQLTGTIEQLQYRNQQLEMQLKRMQDDTEYRLQQLGSKGAAPAAPARPLPPGGQMAPATPGGAVATPGRRSDVFDPSQNPDAPGVPRTLGSTVASAAPAIDQPIGVPDGRSPGAPLDLSTLSRNVAPAQADAGAAAPQPDPAPVMASAPRAVAPNTAPNPPQSAPPRAAGTQMATLPPSAKPQDEYDLAYGYVLHKDYALAEQAFRDFLRKYPNERLVPDAQYWLGESLFQRQRYRDAAESFLAVSTKHERAGKAPNALLRLGQSLAALNQKEAACATLAEVGRKYPKAPGNVKSGVAQEIKRAKC